MIRKIIVPVLLFFVFVCSTPEDKKHDLPVDFTNGPLRVSANKRFLVHENGTPFFYLGDTAWELFHRLNRQEAERYLENRRQKGFTVIQAVVLAELDGLGTPNANGDLPLVDRDPEKPNEPYFKFVDTIVKLAEAKGLYIAMLPTWGDKWNTKWGVGPEIFTPENAFSYGEFLGRRYKDSPNIIWVVGGDRPVESESHASIVRNMALGLRSGDNGNHLITFHPSGGSGSAQYFHDEEWLDFNMRQHGHATSYTGRYDAIIEDYNRLPVKPVFDGEPVYEDHPIAFRPQEQGHSVAADVRRPLYWDLFNGAFGHTYGHHSVWQMWEPGRRPVNRPLMPWYEAIDQPGAGQMQYGRWLMLSRPFLTRIPDSTVIVADTVETSVPGAGLYRFVATRDTNNTYLMVYAPVGRSFTVNTSIIKGQKLAAWWYNPRNGEATLIGKIENKGKHSFISPDPGEALDWILVIDDVSKNYPAPGKSIL